MRNRGVERRPARALAIVLGFVVAAGLTLPRSASASQGPDPLEPVAYLAGGTWIGEGTWPNGSPLRVEQRYFWGPTKRLLHFEAYDLTGATRGLLYEGFIVYDTKRGKLVQWNVKPSGEVTETEVTRAEGTELEVLGANPRSLVRRSGPNEFHWELRVKQKETWTLILDAVYKRGSPDARRQ
jgi:hypothetical protein